MLLFIVLLPIFNMRGRPCQAPRALKGPSGVSRAGRCHGAALFTSGPHHSLGFWLRCTLDYNKMLDETDPKNVFGSLSLDLTW